MTQTSRFLDRNRVVFDSPPYCDVLVYTLECSDPADSNWGWPAWVRTPYLYGVYVRTLHEDRHYTMRYPEAVFRKFASKNAHYGYERLTRAAACAITHAKHPFSPKFIAKFLGNVPGNELVPMRVF